MREPLPILLVPGLNCSARLYAPQVSALWPRGPVTIANHTRDDSMKAIASRILAAAPPHFALVGLSMGGYIAFEIVRQARDRVRKLALLDTGARADRPEQKERRDQHIALARGGRFHEIPELQFPLLVHPRRREDAELKQIARLMAQDTGAEAFVRQQTAIKSRVDSRPDLGTIRCPTLVLVGDHDELTPPNLAEEMAQGIAGARLVVVPDCGHLSTLEQPEAVNAALIDWLKG